MRKINVIAVAGANNEIGYKNKLIWDVPEDMKRFKELTLGKVVIMGRRTFESLKKPLAGRQNIVITRNKNYKVCEGVKVVNSFQEAIKSGEEECFIIGGGKVYRQAVPLADTIYLTKLARTFHKADSYFPRIPKHFKVTNFYGHNGISFLTYKKESEVV